MTLKSWNFVVRKLECQRLMLSDGELNWSIKKCQRNKKSGAPPTKVTAPLNTNATHMGYVYIVPRVADTFNHF